MKKIGEKVKITKNRDRRSDFECDLLMSMQERDITGKKFDALMEAMEQDKLLTITALAPLTSTAVKPDGYVLSIGKYEFPFLFEDKDLL